MPIPDYQTLMLPLLKLIGKHGSLNRADAVQLISDELQLSEPDRKEVKQSFVTD
jgi:restriction endonuclease Mrr